MGLRVEFELPNNEGSEFSESMTLLLKNFERALKRLNTQAKCNSQTHKFALRDFNPTKPVMTQGSPGLKPINKPI